MTPKFEVFMFDRQPRAARDADLFADEVEAGDHLGNRMLDLDASVHLDEEKLAIFPQELDRASAEIANRRHHIDANAAHARALPAREHRRRGFCEPFLLP